MTGYRARSGRRAGPLVLIVLIAALALCWAAPAALASPATMDLAELRQALESGSLSGHMLTTMKGTTPEKIDVQVEGIVDYSWGSLILFEALGPKIEAIGGIAAGMSGSPMYVEDGGVDKLIGALSYGDTFTLKGMGLATPIEYMTAIEHDYPVGAVASLAAPRPPKAGVYKLERPVRAQGGTITSVVVAESAAGAARVDAGAGATVMAPLGILQIGGARPGSPAYEAAAKKLSRTGLLVKAAAGSGAWAGPPAPALEGGSPCVVLFSQGSVWVGAAGTVTYVNGDTALIFGHPFDQLGPIDAALTGGNVDGVWASSAIPYKLIAPRDVKGTCVQDRQWGVQADLGRQPDFFPVATTVTGGKAPVQDESSVSQWVVASQAWPGLPGAIAAQLAYLSVDQASYPGSAETSTEVVVSDGTGTYVVQHDDIWTDPYSVTPYAGTDAESILSSLVANPDGTLQPRIESVSIDAAISPLQRSARIADVTLPDGIATGDNLVRITYYGYGSADLKTVDGTLTIPAGMQLSGRLMVAPAGMDPYGGEEFDGYPGGYGGTAEGPPQTLAELVDELNAQPRNSDLLVSFTPMEGGDWGFGGSDYPVAEAVVPTDGVFVNSFSASTARVTLQARHARIPYGGAALLEGTVVSSGDVPVTIYRLDAGASQAVPVATVVATGGEGMALFMARVPALKRNARLIARVDSVDGSLPGAAAVPVEVAARVTLSGASRLVVSVRPGDADGKARLERKRGKTWVPFKTVTIADGRGTVRLPKGTYTLRAAFSGSAVCAPGQSRPYTVKVR